jgi:GTP-binding protein
MSIAKLQTAGGELKLFSALKRKGIEETAMLLYDWAHPAETAEAAAPVEAE